MNDSNQNNNMYGVNNTQNGNMYGVNSNNGVSNVQSYNNPIGAQTYSNQTGINQPINQNNYTSNPPKKKKMSVLSIILIVLLFGFLAYIGMAFVGAFLAKDTLDTAKKYAINDSAYGYTKAVENAMVTKMYEDPKFTLSDGIFYADTNIFISNDGKEYELSIYYSGTQPTSGKLVVRDGIVVSTNDLIISGYTITIEDGKVTDVKKAK